MNRTQISLNPQEISWLKKEAKAQGLSMAGMIRELIHLARLVPIYKKKKRKTLGKIKEQELLERFPFIALGKDAPPTDAKKVDFYLYEEGEPL